MALQDYQLQIGTTDLILGAGTDYIVHGWEGFGIPNIRTSDRERSFDHGSYFGPEYLDARTLSIEATIRGDDAADAMANLRALNMAWYLDSRAGVGEFNAAVTLKAKLPGAPEMMLFGRPRRAEQATNRLITGKSTAILEFAASDPRWYSVLESSVALGIAQAASGFSFPRQFDYGFGGGTSGTLAVENDGTIATAPVVRLNGPMTNASIINETTGDTLLITYTLGSGEYLEIDFAAKTVLLGGTASRYYAKSGSWWELVPGPNDVRITPGSGTGTASIRWRDAWI